MSSMTTPDTTNYVLEDVVVTIFLIIYGVILIFGAFMCLLLILALFRGRKTIFQWPFFRIVQNLLYIDSVFLLVQLVLVFPSMIVEDWGMGPLTDPRGEIDVAEAWYNSKAVKIAMCILEFLPLKGLLYLSLLMALNRLAVFTFPFLKKVFDKDSIGWTIIGCWLIIAVLCILSVFVRPLQKFNRVTMKFEDTGQILIEIPALKTVIDVLDSVIPFIIIVVYVLIFFSVQKKRRMISTNPTATHNSDDTRMLWQAIVIAVFLQLYNITSIVAEIVNEKGLVGYVLNMLDLIFSVCNHSIHSTIFILTNSTIRGFLQRPAFVQKFFCKKTPPQTRTEEKYTHDNTG